MVAFENTSTDRPPPVPAPPAPPLPPAPPTAALPRNNELLSLRVVPACASRPPPPARGPAARGEAARPPGPARAADGLIPQEDAVAHRERRPIQGQNAAAGAHELGSVGSTTVPRAADRHVGGEAAVVDGRTAKDAHAAAQ